MPNPKLSRFLLSAVSLFFALFIVSHDLWAKIYVDIDSPSFRLIPIAICDFNKKHLFGRLEQYPSRTSKKRFVPDRSL